MPEKLDEQIINLKPIVILAIIFFILGSGFLLTSCIFKNLNGYPSLNRTMTKRIVV